jgi:hypothetical protein
MKPVIKTERMNLLSTLLPAIKTVKLFTGALLLILLTVVLQDLLHAQRNHYSFHLSESLLFNSYWCWFFIVFLLKDFFLKQINRFLTHPKTYMTVIAFTIIATILHALVYSITVSLTSYYFYEGSYNISKMLGYTISQDIYKYIFVYAVMGIVYGRRGIPQKKEIIPATFIEPFTECSTIVVANGRNNTLVAVADILFIKSATPYIALHTASKTYLHTETLRSILQQLPSGQFIQVHKSTIINIEKVVSFKSRLNGDYDIQLGQHQIRLSRNYAPHFKKLFDNRSSA